MVIGKHKLEIHLFSGSLTSFVRGIQILGKWLHVVAPLTKNRMGISVVNRMGYLPVEFDVPLTALGIKIL